MNTPQKSLFLGTFNSEYFWKNENFSVLPSVSDPQGDAIINAMDEVQFVFCENRDDILITRYPMIDPHQVYLKEIGFQFLSSGIFIENNVMKDISINNFSICQLLLKKSVKEYFKEFISGVQNFSPFSVTPFTDNLCKYYNIKHNVPNIEAVKKVNSKTFSHNLSKRLFDDTRGKIVNSAEELGFAGKQFLKYSNFLIKDKFGVSGKGNILINSERILDRIVKYINKQEGKGKKTVFVLEPLLKKQIDFSAQFEISEKGELNIVSIQEMHNRGFAFAGIQTAKENLINNLEKQGYLRHVEMIANELYKEGYFGPVCLDSMIIDDGSIVPIIEINARKSMGLINYYIDHFLSRFSVKGNLIYFSLSLRKKVNFENLLDRMDKQEILFKKNKPAGILPLTVNTLYVNQEGNCLNEQEQSFKGRFYVSVISNNSDDNCLILNKMKNIFNEFGINVLN